MRIEQVDTAVAGSWLFVRVRTDTGLTGVGESTVFGWPAAVAAVLDTFRPHLVGADPMRVEHHYNALYRRYSMRGQAVGGALAALDQALWDIRGKHFDAPVWQLLGGRSRDGVRAMGVVLPETGLEEFVASAERTVADGFTALKLVPYGDDLHARSRADAAREVVARVAAVREAVGHGVDLGVELHRNLTPGESIGVCNELAASRPLFVEDPIAPDSVLALGRIAERVGVPLAAGERNTTVWEFGEYAAATPVAYLRPDAGAAGGITHVRKICALAEAHHLGIIPHAVPSGPVALAAHVQLGATVPNWDVQEHLPAHDAAQAALVADPVTVKDGHLRIPETPGLGVELDWDAVCAQEASAAAQALRLDPTSPTAHPVALRPDGSVALR